MIKVVARQINNPGNKYDGRFYGFPVIEETLDIDAMAKHMAEHNSGFSEATCTGVLKALVKCTKEMILDGKNVKIDNLAIFSCGIINEPGGAESAKEFKVNKHVKGVKLRARATGELTNGSLNQGANVRKAIYVVGDETTTEDPTTPDDPTGEEPDLPTVGGGDDQGGGNDSGGDSFEE